MQKLIFDGLAVRTQNKSIIVANVSQEDIENITIVRKSIEILVMQLLKDNITTEHINELKRICALERKIVNSENKDYVELIDLDYKFHTSLARMTNNPFLLEIIEKQNLFLAVFLFYQVRWTNTDL